VLEQCVLVQCVLVQCNINIAFFCRFPQRSTTRQDVLDALEGDDEGVKPAKQHYRGCVTYIHGQMTQIALIFASTLLMSLTEHDCTFVFADATFHTAPKPFAQVFNILVSYKGVVLPVFHILMTSKLHGLYRKVFERVKELCPSFKPSYVNTDFEGALIKSIKNVFPNAVVNGCWFHYKNALHRAIMGPSKF